MKKNLLGVIAVVCSGTVWAADFVDTARVISSAPIYERVSEPKQECWNETVSTSGTDSGAAPTGDRSIGGALIGGVVGGIVGNQVGQGTGKTVATATGAVAGAIIGDRMANPATPQASQTPQTRQEQRCRQVENSREVIRGYNVTYRYNGQDITARLPYQPGSTVRVGVSVLGDGNASSDVRDNRSSDRRDRRGKDRNDRGYDN
ncbi:MAG: glycine zipper 2TM domain-containing protein [Gallionellaceae bacterium]|nr:glycine zipper 2TM domain-containing protein [Gallionellaceae bacterium]